MNLLQIMNCRCQQDCTTDQLAKPQEVEVLRVKNELDPAAAGKSAPEEAAADATGYRDVGVNLRVVSDAARERGVHCHVAEVSIQQMMSQNAVALEGCLLWRSAMNTDCTKAVA